MSCPLTGCDKTFSSDLGLNYHFTHAQHDIPSIIISVLATSELSESELEKHRDQLLQQANNVTDEERFPIQRPITIYYHGTRRRDTVVLFGRNRQTTVPPMDGSRKR